jgi:integrase
MFEGVQRYAVRATRFESGERFVLLYDGRDGLPLPDVTRYSAVFRRSKEGSVSTMEQELRAIAVALAWADDAGVDLEQRIGAAAFLFPEEVLSLRDSLRMNLRANDGKPINPGTHYSRCVFVRDYIKWRGEHVVQRIPNGDSRFMPARTRLDEFCAGMTALLPKIRAGVREGVTADVEARLRDVIRPNHPDNPFQRQHQHRNHALLLCYLDLGVRLSEALVIQGSDLDLTSKQPTVTIHRRPDDLRDRRTRQPLVKTAGRILPLGAELYVALESWVMTHRRDTARYRNAKKCPFIFVARNGKGMAIRTAHDLFVQLRNTVEGLPTNLSAHIARHTWNDNFSRHADEVRMPEAEEERFRGYLMGWKKGSKQAATYTRRHTREAASEHSLRLQRKNLQGQHR